MFYVLPSPTRPAPRHRTLAEQAEDPDFVRRLFTVCADGGGAIYPPDDVGFAQYRYFWSEVASRLPTEWKLSDRIARDGGRMREVVPA